MKEIRTVLTETSFSNLCKKGYIAESTSMGKTDLNFNKSDIKVLISGEILEKIQDDTKFLFILQDIGLENIKEIIKRSPIFSELAQNM